MKIVIISNLYPPFVRGGAEIIAQRMAESLRDHLQHVSVITTEPYHSLRSLSVRPVTINEIEVYRFFPFNIYYYLFDYKFPAALRLIWHVLDIFNLHSYYSVRKKLKALQPDVVITHNLMGIGFLIPRLIRKLHIRHVHVIHDLQLYRPSGLLIKGKEKDWAQVIADSFGYSKLMCFLFDRVDLVISPSQFLLDFYRTKGFFKKSKTQLLPNIVEIPEKGIQKKESKTLRLVFVGQITEAKGIEGFIRSLILDPGLGIELKVIGLGPALKQLIATAQGDERITFYGWRNKADILGLFAQSDALLVPSLCYENSPTVIFEALSLGVPVIASKIGGIPEIIHDGINGLLFPAGEWNALKTLLHSLQTDPMTVETLAANARKSVEGFSSASYTERLVSLIDT